MQSESPGRICDGRSGQRSKVSSYTMNYHNYLTLKTIFIVKVLWLLWDF